MRHQSCRCRPGASKPRSARSALLESRPPPKRCLQESEWFQCDNICFRARGCPPRKPRPPSPALKETVSYHQRISSSTCAAPLLNLTGISSSDFPSLWRTIPALLNLKFTLPSTKNDPSACGSMRFPTAARKYKLSDASFAVSFRVRLKYG